MCICVFQAHLDPIHEFLAMYVTKPRLFFDHALRNRFAVPSFNVCNLEIARGVITAAEAEDAPVILQTYFGDLYHGGVHVLSPLLPPLAEHTTGPVLVPHMPPPCRVKNFRMR